MSAMLHTNRTQRRVARCFHELSRAGRGLQTIGVVALLLFGLVVGAQPHLLHAQESDSLEQASQEQSYRIETTEGNVLVGTLVSETETEVVLDTRQLGEVTVKRTDIESIEKLDAGRFQDGAYWFQNPQSTRYFFGTNAIGIPEGEGYYQNTWVLFNNVNYGVSDNFSIGAGTVPIFLFGAPAVPVWVLPKVSISTPQENLHLAGGAIFGGVLGVDDSGSAGLLYGVATVGTRDHNATLGVGYGLLNGELSDVPAVTVSGMTRIGRTTYLLSENYFVPTEDGGNVISLGLRWAPRNFAVDFGLFRSLSADVDFIGFPWLGVTIPFGQ